MVAGAVISGWVTGEKMHSRAASGGRDAELGLGWSSGQGPGGRAAGLWGCGAAGLGGWEAGGLGEPCPHEDSLCSALAWKLQLTALRLCYDKWDWVSGEQVPPVTGERWRNGRELREGR